MDDAFAAYAWENDQRISQMTGQPFSALYRENVLANHQQKFDSGPATRALTAVSLTEPTRESEALKAFQTARYVEGLDITSHTVLARILRSLNLEKAAENTALSPADLYAATQDRAEQAQRWMQAFGVRGVPAFIAEPASERRIFASSSVYMAPQEWVRQLQGFFQQ